MDTEVDGNWLQGRRVNVNMIDDTENIRRKMVDNINSAIESDNEEAERKRLESQYGQVWDTSQMTAEFEAIGFMAPLVVVRRRSDGKKGSLQFQHRPRFYFNFSEA